MNEACRWADRSAFTTRISTALPAFQTFDKLLETTIQHLRSTQHAANTEKMTMQMLKQLNRITDIHNPQAVTQTIFELKNEKTKQPLNNNTKRKLQLAYFYFCTANQIEGYKPIKYKLEEQIPIIPTKLQIEKIIAATHSDCRTIFKILAETGAEGEELHKTTRYMIDTEQRAITMNNRNLTVAVS